MKLRTILLLCASIIFNFQFSTLNSQELPQGYFRNPLGSDIGLSATFSEFRNNHFHAGLDMRTGGAIGKPVYAAADGYVAKVSISPWGGGNILYIKHPNGYTTVYMHLDSYAGAIGKAVLREQYAQQSYSISKLFAPGELPVKQGQLVALSGNSGGSGGPHLHFEVRRGGLEDLHTHATLYNPLLFGLPYKDSVKPTIRGLRLYPANGTSEASTGNPLSAGTPVTVDGPFYLGIYASDAAEGSTARNGIDRVEVYLDGALFFMYTTESLPVDSSRMVNALIDYPHFRATRQAYLLTRALPGAEGPWIPVRQGDGIFRLRPGTTHSIGIKVYDIMENCAEQVLTVHAAGSETPSVPRYPGAIDAPQRHNALVHYVRPFDLQSATYALHLLPHTLYADDYLHLGEKAGRITVEPRLNSIPPHVGYTLSLKGSLPKVSDDKVVVTLVDGSRLSAYPTTHADGWHTATVRDWGTFALMADTTAPTVRPLNFSESKPLKVSTLKVKIGDDLAGVDTYHCYLNGQWILGEYDGKSATVSIDARGKLRTGKNDLRVEVTDGCGNIADKTWRILRQ